MIFIQENTFEIVLCEMVAIVSVLFTIFIRRSISEIEGYLLK